MASAGNAARRRPSVDWPMSREEKKFQAMHLYEKDVQTCNQLLQSQDGELRGARAEIKKLRRESLGAKEEIKELRRASMGSTARGHTSMGSTDTGGRSTPDADVNLSPRAQSTDEESTELSEGLDAQGICDEGKVKTNAQLAELAEPRTASPSRHSTSMRRSNSLEVVSTWLAQPVWGPQPDSTFDIKMQRRNNRTASPRRSSNWWASSWKAVRNGVKTATETATETARILVDEAAIIADEVREAIPLIPGLADPDAVVPPSRVTVAPAQFMEWNVDLGCDPGRAGLKLELSVEGEPRRVQAVAQGLAIDAWNSCKAPVTVFLQPGSREKVTRMVVRPGDELLLVDGEDVEHALEEVETCKTLMLRRQVYRRSATEAAA